MESFSRRWVPELKERWSGMSDSLHQLPYSLTLLHHFNSLHAGMTTCCRVIQIYLSSQLHFYVPVTGTNPRTAVMFRAALTTMNGRSDVVLTSLLFHFLTAPVAVNSGLQATISQYLYSTSTIAAVAASARLRSFTSQVTSEL